MLKQIGEIEIDGSSFQVAKNGEYSLVYQSGKDAYDTPIYAVYDLVDAEREDGVLLNLCKGLIQVVGKLLTEKQAVADSRRASLQGTKTEE